MIDKNASKPIFVTCTEVKQPPSRMEVTVEYKELLGQPVEVEVTYRTITLGQPEAEKNDGR